MFLKSIRAHGFKSFADKMCIDINSGITVIVGPNGSGKSNVVDAVRWVLGEQSIKELRGSSSMSDVIFSGSSSRNPQSRASVALTFDNVDHYLNCDYDEVEVKRICYKTGENEYYINNVQVRLKDILDLFIDSGAGKESFNLISQGKVKDIIEQKPENRRVLIEEAAGVLKYKKRKEEAKRKLDKTKDNLERIDLIIKELETTKNPLEEQAIIARKYVDYKKNLENIEISLIAHDINDINEKYKFIKAQLDIDKEKLDKMEFSSKNNDSQIEKLKTSLLKLEEKIAIKNKDVLDITEKLSSLETEKQLAKERNKYTTDKEKIDDNIISLKEEVLGLKTKLKILNSSLEENTNKQLEISNKITNIHNELQSSNLMKQNLEENININKRKIMELNNKKEIIENNIQNDTVLPYSIKSLINKQINGLHNILGNLIEIPEDYSTAIDTALGFNFNVVIVDNEAVTKECINYLKNNNLGRATFFPLNVISARGIDTDTINKLKNIDGFIDIASNVVKYNQI